MVLLPPDAAAAEPPPSLRQMQRPPDLLPPEVEAYLRRQRAKQYGRHVRESLAAWHEQHASRREAQLAAQRQEWEAQRAARLVRLAEKQQLPANTLQQRASSRASSARPLPSGKPRMPTVGADENAATSPAQLLRAVQQLDAKLASDAAPACLEQGREQQQQQQQQHLKERRHHMQASSSWRGRQQHLPAQAIAASQSATNCAALDLPEPAAAPVAQAPAAAWEAMDAANTTVPGTHHSEPHACDPLADLMAELLEAEGGGDPFSIINLYIEEQLALQEQYQQQQQQQRAAAAAAAEAAGAAAHKQHAMPTAAAPAVQGAVAVVRAACKPAESSQGGLRRAHSAAASIIQQQQQQQQQPSGQVQQQQQQQQQGSQLGAPAQAPPPRPSSCASDGENVAANVRHRRSSSMVLPPDFDVSGELSAAGPSFLTAVASAAAVAAAAPAVAAAPAAPVPAVTPSAVAAAPAAPAAGEQPAALPPVWLPGQPRNAPASLPQQELPDVSELLLPPPQYPQQWQQQRQQQQQQQHHHHHQPGPQQQHSGKHLYVQQWLQRSAAELGDAPSSPGSSVAPPVAAGSEMEGGREEEELVDTAELSSLAHTVQPRLVGAAVVAASTAAAYPQWAAQLRDGVPEVAEAASVAESQQCSSPASASAASATAGQRPAAPVGMSALSELSASSRSSSAVTSTRLPGAPVPPGSSTLPDGSTTLSGSVEFGHSLAEVPGKGKQSLRQSPYHQPPAGVNGCPSSGRTAELSMEAEPAATDGAALGQETWEGQSRRRRQVIRRGNSSCAASGSSGGSLGDGPNMASPPAAAARFLSKLPQASSPPASSPSGSGSVGSRSEVPAALSFGQLGRLAGDDGGADCAASEGSGSAGGGSDGSESHPMIAQPAAPHQLAVSVSGTTWASSLRSGSRGGSGSSSSRPRSAGGSSQAGIAADADVLATASEAATAGEGAQAAEGRQGPWQPPAAEASNEPSTFFGSKVEISYGEQYGSPQRSPASAQQRVLTAAAADTAAVSVAGGQGSGKSTPDPESPRPSQQPQQQEQQQSGSSAVLHAACSPRQQPGMQPQAQRPRSPHHAADERYPGSPPASPGQLQRPMPAASSRPLSPASLGGYSQRVSADGGSQRASADGGGSRRASADGSAIASRPGSPAGMHAGSLAGLTGAPEHQLSEYLLRQGESLATVVSPSHSGSSGAASSSAGSRAGGSPHAQLRFGATPGEAEASPAAAATGAEELSRAAAAAAVSPETEAAAEVAGSPPGTPVMLSPAAGDESCPGSAHVYGTTVVQNEHHVRNYLGEVMQYFWAERAEAFAAGQMPPLGLEGYLAIERRRHACGDAQHIFNKLLFDAANEALVSHYGQALDSYTGRMAPRLALLSRERLEQNVVQRVLHWAGLGCSAAGGCGGADLSALLAEDAAEDERTLGQLAGALQAELASRSATPRGDE